MNKLQVWKKTSKKSYALQLKVCKEQVGFQDQAQWCVLGMTCHMWVQSGTWH